MSKSFDFNMRQIGLSVEFVYVKKPFGGRFL